MKIGYYPGCTLKTKARNLEIAAIKAMQLLDIEMVELEKWNCCGAVYSLADDDLVHFLAPVRDLIRARDQGFDKVVTLCSMCYNTLARANLLMRNDEVKRKALNDFMEEESNYAGEVEVLHLLTLLRDEIGWEKVAETVSNPLNEMKLAPYYGCTLTRPRDVTIESADSPEIFGQFIEAIGAQNVEFSDSETCCGAYQVVSNPDAAVKTSAKIIDSAGKAGANALVLSCPLCEYNLGRLPGNDHSSEEGQNSIPTIYFSQLLAIALGIPVEETGIELNTPATVEFLQRCGVLQTA